MSNIIHATTKASTVYPPLVPMDEYDFWCGLELARRRSPHQPTRPGLLARIRARFSPKAKWAAPQSAKVKEGGEPVTSSPSTRPELRTVPASSPLRPGDPRPSLDGAENQELRVALVPSTSTQESGDSAGAARG